MTKFNKKPVSVVEKERTKNFAGGEMFTTKNEIDLYSAVVTCMFSDKFYESNDDRQKRIIELIKKCDPLFVAKLAIYTREKMNMRTIPLVLCCELAKIHNGDSIISRMVSRVIQRPDELTEILAYYVVANGRDKATKIKKLNRLSNQIRVGIGKAFNKFNEYQFAKYNRQNEIKLRDALFLSHPKANSPEQQKIFDKIVNDTLETPYTWEVELSAAGKNGKSKKDVWEELIESNKVGYMALLRNLRNIKEADVSKKHITMVCERLADKQQVLKSKQLPFRFLSAYLMINGIERPMSRVKPKIENSFMNNCINEALEAALVHSISNIPVFDNETVLISSDVSGSMMSSISEKSIINPFYIGLLLSSMLKYKCKFVDTTIFGDTVATMKFQSKEILKSTVDMVKEEGKVGYSTNGYKVIEYAMNTKYLYDRIMIFTDCQLYGSNSLRKMWLQYKKINPTCKLYLFNLAGYGGLNFSSLDKDVYTIAGWSDKIFDVMVANENKSGILDIINSIEF